MHWQRIVLIAACALIAVSPLFDWVRFGEIEVPDGRRNSYFYGDPETSPRARWGPFTLVLPLVVIVVIAGSRTDPVPLWVALFFGALGLVGSANAVLQLGRAVGDGAAVSWVPGPGMLLYLTAGGLTTLVAGVVLSQRRSSAPELT